MIPDEAVEAAAKAFWENGGSYSWADEYSGVKADCLADIRAALEAAAPHMLAEAWDDGRRGGLLFPRRFDNPYRSQG